MKTRDEREKELQNLARTDKGKWELTNLVKRYQGLHEGQTLPVGTLLIQAILQHEYPQG